MKHEASYSKYMELRSSAEHHVGFTNKKIARFDAEVVKKT